MGYLIESAARGGYADDYSGRKVRLPRFAMNGGNWPMNGACVRRMSVRGRFVVAPAHAPGCIATTRRRGTSTSGADANRGRRACVAADRQW
ncbi:hypothetical protein [Burkholderia stagnalis]|uniref:hypothetical protein n=1 Tax=Burkholderia stagnalis TaxID=1503054 RepID=UPI000AD4F861|nr:hypothetical protein [Burkholderia stagnalis]